MEAEVRPPRPRNPLLVLVWSFGILLVVLLPVQYGAAGLLSVIEGVPFSGALSGDVASPSVTLWQGLVAFFIGIPIAVIAVRYLWRRDWDWLCFRPSLRLALVGLTIGLVFPGLAVAVLAAVTEVQMSCSVPSLSWGSIACIVFGGLGGALSTGVTEELVFRGMTVREWALKWGWIPATVLGGLFFGVLHLQPLLSTASIAEILWVVLAAIVATAVFVALYVRSSSLWLPIGFHAGWNFSLYHIFGTTMSGEASGLALMQTEVGGFWLLSGGEFGMEASAVTIVLWALLAVLVLYFRRTGDLLASGKGHPTETTR